MVARITSGMNIFVHGAAATPTELLEALARRTDLENVRLDATRAAVDSATFVLAEINASMPGPTAARSPNAARCSCQSRTRTSGAN